MLQPPFRHRKFCKIGFIVGITVCKCFRPPGVAPTAAQLAAMQGRQVIVNQEKGGFLEGSGSGGVTFW